MNPFMERANALAKDNLTTNVGGPFGAVIVKDGKIVGEGSNHVLESHDPTAHAEVMAIRHAASNLGTHDLSGCTLYTSCYPCPMCLSAIIWANIRTVYYGNTKEDAAEIGFRDDFIYSYIGSLSEGSEDKNTLDLQPMDREETLKTFRDFQNKEDKTIY